MRYAALAALRMTTLALVDTTGIPPTLADVITLIEAEIEWELETGDAMMRKDRYPADEDEDDYPTAKELIDAVDEDARATGAKPGDKS